MREIVYIHYEDNFIGSYELIIDCGRLYLTNIYNSIYCPDILRFVISEKNCSHKIYYDSYLNDIIAWKKYTQECVK